MRFGPTLTFAGTGSQVVNQGQLVIRPKKKCRHIDLKIVVPLRNGTGGTAALTFAQVKTFLGGFSLTSQYGNNGRQPHVNMTFDKLLQDARDSIGDIWPGTQDTVTGMMQNIATVTTANATFYAQIPFAGRWKDPSLKDLGGIGPYQASTMQLTLNWNSTTLPASWTVNGNVTMKILYPEESCRFEVFDFVGQYKEFSTSNQTADLQDGLTQFVWETTAAAASTALTNVTVTVDGAEYPVHEQVGGADISEEFNADPELPSNAAWTDTYTALLAYNTQRQEREYDPGAIHISQNGSVQLSPMVLGQKFRPIVNETEIAQEVSIAAKTLKREVRAVYLSDALGVRVPDWLKPFTPLAFLTAQEADSRSLASMRATENSGSQAYVPVGLAAMASAQVNAHAGNSAAQGSVVARLAGSIPGGSSNPSQQKRSGAAGSSGVLSAVAGQFLRR